MDHEDIICIALSHIPRDLKDDARQAGYIGLMQGLKNKNKVVSNFRGYLYRCVTNEIIKEMSKLYRPFSLNSKLFCKLLKYKKLRGIGANKLINNELEKLLQVKQWSYSDYEL
jgi:DNA-directed RNA polymerase specialized sigma subunit